MVADPKVLESYLGPASMPENALLTIDGLCVAYDGSCALNGVSLQIHKGELICVVGANGAGRPHSSGQSRASFGLRAAPSK